MTMSVELTEEDIQGAALKEPLESHTVHALKWWLLCRGERLQPVGRRLSMSPGTVIKTIMLYMTYLTHDQAPRQ